MIPRDAKSENSHSHCSTGGQSVNEGSPRRRNGARD